MPGVERKCHEPLVFTLNGNAGEEVVIYVNEIAQGFNTYDDWVSVQLDPQNPTGGGDRADIWWSSDQTIQYPEFVAVYSSYPKYAGGEWVGEDPSTAGLPIVSIPSTCP